MTTRPPRSTRTNTPFPDTTLFRSPDRPGHVRSAHLPPGADYSFAGALHSVLDVADALGWERFALLGHSMGAGIASLLAAGAPGRVERLLAIEALGALPEAPENRSEEHTSALQSLMRISYAVFCLNKKNHNPYIYKNITIVHKY